MDNRLERAIIEILSPAIDTRAPFAQAMIAQLIALAEAEYLKGATDARSDH